MRELKELFWQVYLDGYANGHTDEDINSPTGAALARDKFEIWWTAYGRQMKFDAGNPEEGSEIEIVPVTKYPKPPLTASSTRETYMFSNFEGFRGRILGKSKNGDFDAYLVKIAKDGCNPIITSINVEDVKFLK